MASAAVKCSAVILVLQLCVCIVAGTRVVDFEQLSDLTTSGAARDESTTGGNQQGRSLLAAGTAGAGGTCDGDSTTAGQTTGSTCEAGFTCDPTSKECVATAPAPAPAMQPRIGSMGGPPMTPAATSKATPSATAASVFSTATTVPAITSVATLSAYATVAAFDTTEQTRFCSTLEANILKVQGVVANCTITSVVLGSVKVANTLAFTGSDATAAEAARASVATALSSGTANADYFGNSFGTVSVSDVKATTTTNPTAKSGSVALGASLAGLVGGLTILALTLISA